MRLSCLTNPTTFVILKNTEYTIMRTRFKRHRIPRKTRKSVCCEIHYNRGHVASEIMMMYKTMYSDYLQRIVSDVGKFVGKRIGDRTASIEKEAVIALLMDLPLVDLLGFLGSAYLSFKRFNFDKEKLRYMLFAA
jgi:hypothetical protein